MTPENATILAVNVINDHDTSLHSPPFPQTSPLSLILLFHVWNSTSSRKSSIENHNKALYASNNIQDADATSAIRNVIGEAWVRDLERDLGIVMTSEDVLAQITEETANFVAPEPARELEGRFGGAPGPQLHSMELRNVLKVFVEAGITLVEFGDQITYRYGWPQILNMVDWFIPDNQMSRVSTILRRNGWSETVLSGDRFTRGRGYWSEGCQPHLIDDWTVVVLLPLSSVGIWLHQTELVPSTFFPEYNVQTPLLPHYVATLIDYVLAHRVGFRHLRHQAETDLLRFIFVHLLHAEPVYTGQEPDHCILPPVGQIEEYERRVAEGISVVRGWH